MKINNLMCFPSSFEPTPAWASLFMDAMEKNSLLWRFSSDFLHQISIRFSFRLFEPLELRKSCSALPLNDSAPRASEPAQHEIVFASLFPSPSFVLTNLSIFAIAIVYRLMARSEIGKQFYAARESSIRRAQKCCFAFHLIRSRGKKRREMFTILPPDSISLLCCL
jgi:hypothetical protein